MQEKLLQQCKSRNFFSQFDENKTSQFDENKTSHDIVLLCPEKNGYIMISAIGLESKYFQVLVVGS